MNQSPDQLRNAAKVALTAAGFPSPGVDSRHLLAHVAGVEPIWLRCVRELTPAQEVQYADLVRRRLEGEPLQHLTGKAYFRHETLAVGPGVFIPRPETEELVQLVIDWLGERSSPDPLIVDLGTGSGAVALALAHETGARIIAVERDAQAAVYANRNLDGTGVELRVGDWRSTLADLTGTVDVVVANPPYVPLTSREALPPDVTDPPEALFAGEDGLDAIRDIVPLAVSLLRVGGLLACEHDDTHGEAVPALLLATGEFAEVADHRDLAGRDRYATATRETIDHLKLTA